MKMQRLPKSPMVTSSMLMLPYPPQEPQLSEDELQLLDAIADEVEMDRLRKMGVFQAPEAVGSGAKKLSIRSSAPGGTIAYPIVMCGLEDQGSLHESMPGSIRDLTCSHQLRPQLLHDRYRHFS